MPLDLSIDPALPLVRRQLLRMAAYGVSGDIVILSNGGRVTGMKPRYRMKRYFVDIHVDYQRELSEQESAALELLSMLIPELWARRKEVKNAQIVIEVNNGVPQPDFDWEPYIDVLAS